MKLTAEALHDLAQPIAKVPREARIEHANGTVVAEFTVEAGHVLEWPRGYWVAGLACDPSYRVGGPLGCRVRPGPGYGIRYDANHPWITVASYPDGWPGQLVSWRPSIDDAARQLRAHADFARDQIVIPAGALRPGESYQFTATGRFDPAPHLATAVAMKFLTGDEVRAAEGLPAAEPAWCRRCGGTGTGCWCPEPQWSDEPRYAHDAHAVEDLPALDDLPAY